MSEYTELALDMIELEAAGLVKRVMRMDGQEAWELTSWGVACAAVLAEDDGDELV